MNRKLKRQILHLFYPNRCPVCGDIIGAEDRFCEYCDFDIQEYDGFFNIAGAASFTAAYTYNDDIAPAVFLLKNGICGNAAYALGNGLADRLIAEKINTMTDLIIPVPMHKADRRQRGYNQAELIADVVGERLGIPVDKVSVVKRVRTFRQKMLSRDMRRDNLKNAFTVQFPENISGNRILLVDDVSTTGNTMKEILNLLLINGAAEVRCAACCHPR